MVPVHPHGEPRSRGVVSSQAGTFQRQREARWYRTCVHRAWRWPPGHDFRTSFPVNMCQSKGTGSVQLKEWPEPRPHPVRATCGREWGSGWSCPLPATRAAPARCCVVPSAVPRFSGQRRHTVGGAGGDMEETCSHVFGICSAKRSWASVSSLEKY